MGRPETLARVDAGRRGNCALPRPLVGNLGTIATTGRYMRGVRADKALQPGVAHSDRVRSHFVTALIPLSPGRHRSNVLPHEQDWTWSQSWRDVLFLHWEVDDRPLLAHLPAVLEIDRWQGSTWISAVAFRLSEVRLHGLPPIP